MAKKTLDKKLGSYILAVAVSILVAPAAIGELCFKGKPGSVTFHVRDAESENYISHPTVQMFPTNSIGVSGYRYTSENGEVTVCDLAPGTYNFQVTRNYPPKERGIKGTVRIPRTSYSQESVWLAPVGTAKPPSPVKPVQQPKPPSGSSRCPDNVANDAQQKLAHNAAQNPGSGSVWTKWMGTVESCSNEHGACHKRARANYDQCPPGADGTYTQCGIAWQTAKIQCSNQEIRCTQRALGCGEVSTPPVQSGQCTAAIRNEAADKLAHNAAQKPGSGSVWTKWMGRVKRCSSQHGTCHKTARATYDQCPPGTDGTYTQCGVTWQTTKIQCSNQEINCTLNALSCR